MKYLYMLAYQSSTYIIIDYQKPHFSACAFIEPRGKSALEHCSIVSFLAAHLYVECVLPR